MYERIAIDKTAEAELLCESQLGDCLGAAHVDRVQISVRGVALDYQEMRRATEPTHVTPACGFIDADFAQHVMGGDGDHRDACALDGSEQGPIGRRNQRWCRFGNEGSSAGQCIGHGAS